MWGAAVHFPRAHRCTGTCVYTQTCTDTCLPMIGTWEYGQILQHLVQVSDSWQACACPLGLNALSNIEESTITGWGLPYPMLSAPCLVDSRRALVPTLQGSYLQNRPVVMGNPRMWVGTTPPTLRPGLRGHTRTEPGGPRAPYSSDVAPSPHLPAGRTGPATATGSPTATWSGH